MARVNISELNIKIVATAKGLTNTIRRVNGSIENFRARARKANPLNESFTNFNKILGRTIALYAAFNAFDFVKNQLFDSVRLAADAELAKISLEVLIGSAEHAESVLKDLYGFVETTPFRLTDVRDSAQLLAAFGVEAKQLLPTLRTLGDISAGINQPIRELADLYGRTLNEQRLYTRDLNQFTSRGIPLIQEFAKTFGVLENEVRGLAEAGVLTADDVTDALARMTSEGGRFFRLTERQAKTTAGEYSNLLDEVDGLKRSFGEGLLPVLRDLLAITRELIIGTGDGTNSLNAMRDAGKSLGEWMRWMGAVVQGVRLEFVLLWQAATTVGMAFEETGRIILGLRTGGFFKTMNEELAHSNKELQESIRRLTNYEKSLFTAASAQKKLGDSLADSIELVPLAVRRAQNALKQLTASATTAADKIRKEFATPLDKFKEAVAKIANARLLGGLEEDVAKRALKAEVDRLDTATEELRKVQQQGAVRKGSQEEIAARNQRTQRVRTGGDGFNRAALFRIASQIFGEQRGKTVALRKDASSVEVAKLRAQQSKESEAQLTQGEKVAGVLLMILKNPSVIFNEVSA